MQYNKIKGKIYLFVALNAFFSYIKILFFLIQILQILDISFQFHHAFYLYVQHTNHQPIKFIEKI